MPPAPPFSEGPSDRYRPGFRWYKGSHGKLGTVGHGAHGDKTGSPEAGKRKAVAGERGQGSLRRRSSRPGTASLAVVWDECVICPAHRRAEVFRDIHAPGSAGKPIPGVTGYGSAVESGARRRRPARWGSTLLDSRSACPHRAELDPAGVDGFAARFGHAGKPSRWPISDLSCDWRADHASLSRPGMGENPRLSGRKRAVTPRRPTKVDASRAREKPKKAIPD